MVKSLREAGLFEEAQAVATALDNKKVANEAFTQAQQQEKQRMGIDLPRLRQNLQAAMASSNRNELMQVLTSFGLSAQLGDKPNTWVVVDEQNNLVGALHRLCGQRKFAINELMTTKPWAPSQGVVKENLAPSEFSVQLREMERAARKVLDAPLPVFEPSEPMLHAMKSIAATKEKLAKEKERAEEIRMQIFQSPKVTWWTYVLGKAGQRRAHLERLKRQQENMQANILAFETIEGAQKARHLREERAAKLIYDQKLQMISEQMAAARELVNVIKRAHCLATLHPSQSFKSISELLELAKEAGDDLDEITNASRPTVARSALH